MAKYKDKWKTTFPTSIGNQTRPEDSVDNTQEYNTDGLPQYMANDPVRYDLQNAVNSQLVSNDERLNEKIKRTSDDLAAHNKDPKAHATGIAGNAATASKLLTPRTISLTGKAAGSTSFDGSSNAAINVTSVNADTASKLSTARKINITGNAVGAATFDGSGDVNISTTVNESKHAVNADVAKTLETTDANGVKNNATLYWVGKDGQPMWLWGSNTKPSETYVYNPSNFHVAYADNATNAATATKVNATVPVGSEADLVFGIMANDDSARVRVGGDNDNGWLEIATSDNGNEPIYARQYIGGWMEDATKTITNEAVLLDSNGNTKFPHDVTAANFVGHLAGTADNADTVDGYHASDLLGKIYPVGSIYMSMSATNPHDLFGVGTWERISQGRMLLGADDSTYKAGATGGEATHTLSVNEMPAHSHGISNSGDHTHFVYGSDDRNGEGYAGDGIDTGGNGHFWDRNNRYTTSSAGAHTHTIDNAGGGAAHNNMPPYLVCYIWQRTA